MPLPGARSPWRQGGLFCGPWAGGSICSLSTLLSAAAVCLGGLIGWVGLMVPHMARALVGADYRRLLPASALLGAVYLLLMDDIARSLLSLELPLGVVTSILGAPFFICLVCRGRGR